MAYYGYRGKDAAGNVTVEYAFRVPRILNRVYTGTAPGSIVIPEFAGRVPMYQLLPADGTQTTPQYAPVVTISGTVLSWDFPWAAVYRTPAYICYGIIG